MSDVVSRFQKLFAGRTDVWGADHGECMKSVVVPSMWRKHLSGEQPMGIYPLLSTNEVRWGCVDIDVQDYPMASNLWRTLTQLGVASWIEKSRSKGYHVWVFAEGLVPALDMRHALLVACKVAGVPPKEVNPKQVDLDSKKPYGNYVRLPYPGALTAEPERQVMVTPEKEIPIPFWKFLETAWGWRVKPARLAEIAQLLPPEPPKKTVEIIEPSQLTGRIPALAKHILDNGPLDGDRSAGLFKLALVLRDGRPDKGIPGLTPGETLTYLIDADQRWGKFHNRPNGRELLEGIVTRAYQ